MTAPFEVPKGDPDAIRREAGRIGRAGADMARASKQVETHAVTALKGWNGIHAAMFAVTAGGTFTALGVQGDALKAVSQGLKKYAGALEKAQHDVRFWIREYDKDERELAQPGLSAEKKHNLEYNLRDRYPYFARRAKEELGDNKQASAPLALLGQLKLEKKADPDPKGLWERFLHSSPYHVYTDIKNATDPVLAVYSLMEAGTKAGTVYQFMKQGVLGKMAQRKMSRAELERALLSRLWREGGRGLSHDALKAQARQLADQIASANRRVETAERIMREAQPKLAADLGEGLAAGRYARVAKGLAKGSAILGIVAGVDGLLNNQDTGWVRTGNYIADGSGVAGGLLVLFAGVIGSFTGATETVVIVGLALGTISAGWTFGKFAVQQGKKNEHARGVGSWLKKHTTDKAVDAWRKFTWSMTHPAG
ncbi:hypothetical protein FH608_048930 [Nonomuraea phyllanthi]|uniref:Uncharacterized protein n=1 Tax=Nonomuraea phyllanthi TaxID=2219224 RepID=A0A5C4UYK5_9ACTN|nr:hypothetical protein [Nonomuraea phyllanthi]KAB8183588.1 hypothetical protein FH608_048930 [Nonomuraea phyllanthi]QFY09457.1 hypothetical protein GBF35_24935 [Nonomuraea phyllanthi]